MVRGLLADANAEGHCRAILAVCRGPLWRTVWDGLGIAAFEFADIGIDKNLPDLHLWHLCQRERLVLITGNRNASGATSLDTAIREHSTPHSLPVVTIADMGRLLNDRAYMAESVERLLEFLLEMDTHLGSGRLYIP
jgi:hypothetical protein